MALNDSAVPGSLALLKSENETNDRFSLLRVIGIPGQRSQEYFHRNLGAGMNPAKQDMNIFHEIRRWENLKVL